MEPQKSVDDNFTYTPTKTLTTKQKIIVSFGCLSTNVGWALSESLIIPYLLIIGAPLYVCSWTWFFSPILSAYIGPKLDELCDNWSSRNCWGWTGRKKFVSILSLISAFTMLLLPQSENITKTLFQTDSISLTFVIALMIFTVMDTSFYLLLRPLQALIWDVTTGNKDVYMDTMKIFNVIQGVCRMSGLIIVAICISFDTLFGGTMSHIASAFTLGAILIIFGTFFSLFYSPNIPEMDDGNNRINIPYSNSSYTSNLFTTTNVEHHSNSSEVKHLLDVAHYGSNTEFNYNNNIDEYDTDEDDDISSVNGNFLSINDNVGYSLHILWLSQLSGWSTMSAVILFWTSFIAIDIYKGTAINIRHENVDLNSFSWLQFKAGLVFGAYGLLLTSLVSVNCSVLYPFLRKKISTRILYLFGEFIMAFLCILFYLTMNETWLLILIAIFGFVMQIHMQSCHELTENELQKMFKKMRQTKQTIYFEYFMELANVIAPVAVSLFGGPIVYAFDGEFKYLFLLAGTIQLIFDFIVMLLFCNIFPWKLPPISSPR